MTIEYQVLGTPEWDNALFVRVQTGQETHRLLFDCGAGCVEQVPVSDVRGVEHLCFSHLHMDHIGGFDTFFRVTYDRPAPPVNVWGPPETTAIIAHRLRGFMWNLFAGDPGVWDVHDVAGEHVESVRLLTGEAFAVAHPLGTRPFAGPLLATPAFTLHALRMDHLTPSLAYLLREAPRVNLDTERLEQMGLPRGPWLRTLKEPAASVESVESVESAESLEIVGQRYDLAALRRELLVETPGASIAYLTDFLLDEAAMARLVPLLRGCTTIVCESQYRAGDGELARRHHHMTATQAATLAREVGAGELVLMHISQRYRAPERAALLAEARAIFPAAHFPAHWETP